MLKRLLELVIAGALALAAAAPAFALQATISQPTSGPHSMADLNTNFLNPALLSLAGCSSGPTAPTNGPSGAPVLYQCWVNTTTNPAVYEIYDGASWLTIGTINTVGHAWLLNAATLPFPGASTLGGVETVTCAAHSWVSSLSTGGVFGCAQPAASDLSNGTTGSGAVALANSPTFTGTLNGAAASFSSQMAIGGYFYDTFNSSGGYPSAASGGAIGGNFNTGQADVDFWNVFTTGGGLAFDWRQLTGASASTDLMTLDTGGNLTAKGSVRSPAANGYYLGSIQALFQSTNYTILTDQSGIDTLQLGNATDAKNYYFNTSHNFDNRTATATFATITAAGLSLFGSSSGSELIQVPATASGTWTLPAVTDQFVGRATTDALTNKSIAASEVNSGQLAIANGGTNAPSAAAARVSLDVDEATSTGDANYTILSSDRMVYHTALSAARTDMLPAASSVNVGQIFVLDDFRGVASASRTLTLVAAGSDTINGVSSLVAISAQYGAGVFWSDGVSRWTFFPGGSGGGSGTVTNVATDSTLTGGPCTTTCTLGINGPVSASKGGTGVASPAAHTVPFNEGSSAQNNSGAGTAGQALISQGASADPVFVGGPRVLLNTLTASSSPALSDTRSLTSTYNEYEIVFENVLPVTNNTTLEIQVHSGGSFQTTGYLATNFNVGGSGGANNKTTFINPSSPSLVQNSGGGYSGRITVYAPSGTTAPKTWTGIGGHYNGSVFNVITVGGAWQSNGAVDGFQAVFSSGNIASGKIKIYGML
jgi:hypothetical protein